MKRNNKTGQFAKELDHAVMIRFFDEYKKKQELREEAIRRSVSEGSILRGLLDAFLRKLRNGKKD